MSDWREPLRALLDDASGFVTSERSRYYGAPTVNHERIAALWNEWLTKGGTESAQPITATDAAMMMLLLKVARLMQSPDHRDSVADIIGYALCYADCALSEPTVTLPERIAGYDAPVAPIAEEPQRKALCRRVSALPSCAAQEALPDGRTQCAWNAGMCHWAEAR